MPTASCPYHPSFGFFLLCITSSTSYGTSWDLLPNASPSQGSQPAQVLLLGNANWQCLCSDSDSAPSQQRSLSMRALLKALLDSRFHTSKMRDVITPNPSCYSEDQRSHCSFGIKPPPLSFCHSGLSQSCHLGNMHGGTKHQDFWEFKGE